MVLPCDGVGHPFWFSRTTVFGELCATAWRQGCLKLFGRHPVRERRGRLRRFDVDTRDDYRRLLESCPRDLRKVPDDVIRRFNEQNYSLDTGTASVPIWRLRWVAAVVGG